MGCTQSKIENEEAVSRCKERRQFMKEAVSSRNAFAAAHSSYAMALKNTGAVLSDYGQGEVQDVRPSAVPGPSSSASVVTAAVAPPMDETLPPPPPPLPDFSPSPLLRSASMPDLPMDIPRRKNPNNKSSPADASIREEEDGHDLEDDVRGGGGAPGTAAGSSSPAPSPKPESTWDYFFGLHENMPGPSLSQAEEIRPEKEDKEEEEDKFKRATSAASASAAVDADIVGGDDLSPPVTPEKVVVDPQALPNLVKKQKGLVHHQHAASVGSTEASRGKMVAATTPSVSLSQILDQLDDHFLKASESAQEVSKMLEANRLHYHSNFADNRGHIDHSSRVMRVITWNTSLKGLANAKDGKDDFDTEEWETHATILDKLLAWEKKLYDEVKAGELMKLEYQRKVALLNKQKKRGANTEALEKTKAAVSHLHTRYIVDMQSMDSTVSEIQRLRDDQLYPKLAALVDGMAMMWKNMYGHHHSQLKIVVDIRSLDISNAPKETGEHHYEQTVQLWRIVSEWHVQFQKLVTHQKEYIQALNSWLKLNLIPIESSLKDKVSSPPRVHHPPIQALLHGWHDQLEKLPDDLAKTAIFSFSAVINAIMMHQQDELKQKEKCEEVRKEYTRKNRAFEDWYNKYSTRRTPTEEVDPERTESTNYKDPVAERKFVVDTLKKRLEDEEEAHQKLCKQVREKSLGSLKSHLPELFRAMSEFSLACSEMYENLRAISQMQNPAAS